MQSAVSFAVCACSHPDLRCHGDGNCPSEAHCPENFFPKSVCLCGGNKSRDMVDSLVMIQSVCGLLVAQRRSCDGVPDFLTDALVLAELQVNSAPARGPDHFPVS